MTSKTRQAYGRFKEEETKSQSIARLNSLLEELEDVLGRIMITETELNISPPAPEPDVFSVQGTVIAQDTGLQLGGGLLVTLTAGSEFYAVQTNSLGQFAIVALPGTYTLEISGAEGYADYTDATFSIETNVADLEFELVPL